jgi:hypothetical protein
MPVLISAQTIERRLPEPRYIEREGRVFSSTPAPGVQPPVLALDNGRLASLATQSGKVESLGEGDKPLLYQVFMSETGEILAIKQVRGPTVRAVESELARTRVVTPGRRGTSPTAVFFYVEVAVP